MIAGRLIPLSRHAAADNMAIDAAILNHVAAGGPPTLRFYQWNRPTLSLGYFQSYSGSSDWQHLEVEIVRRSSGGGAIMHHHELTYSITLPLANSDTGSREKVYRDTHAEIADVLSDHGVIAIPYRETPGIEQAAVDPFLCFARRTDEDLICGGYKILGSAQRRVRGALLQHGSLLLGVSHLASSLPGIEQLSGDRLSAEGLSVSIAASLSRRSGLHFTPGALADSERQDAIEIRRTHYANPDWTHKRP